MGKVVRLRGPSGFDYATADRGAGALMRDHAGREVILCEWPASLLSMLRAGVLTGTAKQDAEALGHAR